MNHFRGPTPIFVRVILLLALSGWASAQSSPVGSTSSRNASATWTKGDRGLAATLREVLTALSDRLDDCTYKGHFSKTDAVPGLCNSAYDGASDALGGHGVGEELLKLLRYGCARWRNSPMSQQHQQDCESLGRSYWRLEDAVDRAAFASANAAADAATQYGLGPSPTEVSEQIKYLQHINGELEKPRVSPGFAFMAGTLDAELSDWLLHHCPSELVWGVPIKRYARALSTCAALEPELRRFERNTLRLMTSIQTDIGK